jgi:hypothetical protein
MFITAEELREKIKSEHKPEYENCPPLDVLLFYTELKAGDVVEWESVFGDVMQGVVKSLEYWHIDLRLDRPFGGPQYVMPYVEVEFYSEYKQKNIIEPIWHRVKWLRKLEAQTIPVRN